VPLEYSGVCWNSAGWVIVAPGVITVRWIHVGVLLEPLGVCCSGYWIGVGVLLERWGVCRENTGWATVATGVKMVHWIGVGVPLE
jgi:hypothetical protein